MWAFGCILYELVSLKRPFDGDNISQLWDVIVNKVPPDIPPDIDGTIRMIIL